MEDIKKGQCTLYIYMKYKIKTVAIILSGGKGDE
jgi:hypothetical protein